MEQNNYIQIPSKAEEGMKQIFLYADKSNSSKLFEVANTIRKGTPGCLVKWLNPEYDISEEDLNTDLGLSRVFIVVVTQKLLDNFDNNPKLKIAINHIEKNNGIYFPIVEKPYLFDKYSKLLDDNFNFKKQIHGLSMKDSEFEQKLKKQLSNFILDKETIKKIKKQFNKTLFLSYRRDDVNISKKLMREIHNIDNFESVSIWYDDFLTAGEEFNEEILKAIYNSKAFIMSITPNISAKRNDGTDNYVVKEEYPHAKKIGRKILPIKASEEMCEYKQLLSAFPGIPMPITLKTAEKELRYLMSDLPDKESYTSEKLYYLGRAYLAGYFFEQDTERAIKLLDKATEFSDEFGLKSVDLLANGFNSGSLLGEVNYNEELKYRLRATEISKKTLGEYHLDTISSYNNIGIVYYFKGEYNKALEYYEKALEIKEKVFGKDHPNNAPTYNNIGLIYYHNQGDYDKALEYYFKALELQKKFLGENNPNTAISYNNIGEVYTIRGEYDKALEYQFKALEIREKVLGEEHHHTATSYSDIGIVYINKGEYDKGVDYHKKALKIREKVCGENHPDTAKSYCNIGSIYMDKGEYDKALEYYFKDLLICTKISGENHPDTSKSCYNIGMIYHFQGEFDKALEYYFKALSIREKNSVTNHPNTANLFSDIGGAYANKGEFDKAFEYYFKALEIRENFLGKDHPRTKLIYKNLASIYSILGDIDKATEYYKKANGKE